MNVIIGTAGHVDHGTQLIKSSSGIDMIDYPAEEAWNHPSNSGLLTDNDAVGHNIGVN